MTVPSWLISSLRVIPGIRSWRAMWVVAVIALAPNLHALDPVKSVFQFNCQNWSRFAGLPADKISAITQSKDGFIWLGSQNGLIRFDGIEFKSFPINLPTAHGQEVVGLSLARDGRMWFSILSGGYGNFDGRVFGTINDARWTAAETNSHAILAANDGAIWTSSVSGWGRWVEGEPAKTEFIENNKSVFGLWEDATGRVWMALERGLYYWSGNEFKPFPARELNNGVVQSVVTDHAGEIWVATLTGLYRFDAEFRLKEIFWPTTQVNALLVDTHGVVWVGTDGEGLARYQYGKFTKFQKVDGLASGHVTSLFEDREGSLWVGTTEGLSQLTDLKFPLYSEKEGLGPGSVVAVNASQKGGLWLTTGSGATYLDLENATPRVLSSVFSGRAVRRVFEARNGEVYFVDGEKNIGIFSGGLPLKVSPNDSWPEGFAEDATSVLAGIGPRLVRIQAGQFSPYRYDGETPLFHWINNIWVGRDEAILGREQ